MKKINSNPRKHELTSMIDMIFLLLIFFLVTLAASKSVLDEGEIPTVSGLPVSKSSNSIKDYDVKLSIDFVDDSFVGYFLDSDDVIALIKQNIKQYNQLANAGQTIPSHILESVNKRFSFRMIDANSTENEMKQYIKAINRIDSCFIPICDSIANNGKPYPVVVMEMNNDVFYKFILDVNNLVYNRFFKNSMLSRDDGGLLVSVIQRSD